MSELVVELDRAACAPGETITGTARWSGVTGKATPALALGWWTEGAGDRDSGIAAEEKLSGESGRKSFSFVAPDFPCSVNGRIFTVKWAVALRAGDRETRAGLVIGPGATAYDVSGDAEDFVTESRAAKFAARLKSKLGGLAKSASSGRP